MFLKSDSNFLCISNSPPVLSWWAPSPNWVPILCSAVLRFSHLWALLAPCYIRATKQCFVSTFQKYLYLHARVLLYLRLTNTNHLKIIRANVTNETWQYMVYKCILQNEICTLNYIFSEINLTVYIYMYINKCKIIT